ncbi:MAG: hypothetical protein J5628_02055 [Lachnospiraceae bacterium]|nr:hypothetical protein [Lachnospiraceae bacterium]
MMRKRETKPKAMWVYYLVAFATVCLAFASLFGSGYLNPEEKPFANAFHGEFQKFAEETFDKNHDGVFSKAELEAVEKIDLPQLPETVKCAVWNSQWLSCFPNLKMFYCSEWCISELSVRNNPKLAVLDCSKNLITELDLSHNPEIEYVNCSKQGKIDVWDSYTPLKYEGLMKLTLRNNPKLHILMLTGNDVAVLNLADSPDLEILECEENQLVQLDLSANVRLRELKCSVNYLGVLDLRSQQELKLLDCRGNLLTELRLPVEPAYLERLDCAQNLLTELDVHGAPELSELICEENRLETLDISWCTKLSYVNCNYNNAAKINSEGCPEDLWIDSTDVERIWH